MNKYITTAIMLITICLFAAACGKNDTNQAGQDIGEINQSSEKDMQNDKSNTEETENTKKPAEAMDSAESAVSIDDTDSMGSRLIKDQSFELTLIPLGEITFSSYAPDTASEPLADAVFTISQYGKTICTLEGMYENNVRTNEVFNSVEAVSFQDYNDDGYKDIIIICSYSPASGADVGTGYSESRIYTGSESGTFVLEKEVSREANSALAEITIYSVMEFLGVKNGRELWEAAYIKYLQTVDSAAEGIDGYNIIYLDEDDIPELVEIGSSEAAGCRILYYADGEVHKFQLNRLNFTYIQKENLLCNSDGLMDSYYDLVYSLIDGEMVPVASGYYGAEDNSKVEMDEEGSMIYQYHWNNQTVSKEEYRNSLLQIYDDTKAMAGFEYSSISSRDEMIEKLK